jgi:hypothetical protein
MLKLASYFLAYFVLVEAWRALRSPRTRIRWRSLRARDFGFALALIVGVVATGTLLYQAIPATRWGWWSWLGGGNGSALQGVAPPVTHATPVLFAALPLLMALAMAVALPALVHAEERQFRRGAEGWDSRKRLAMPVAFGLCHLLMGIPVAFALAIGVAGAGFQWRYLQAHQRTRSRYDAMRAAVRAHMAYNTLILAVWIFAAGALLALRLLDPAA